MGRQSIPQIKTEFLEKIASYILLHGLQDLSLRSLAKSLGTTARMLLYHFESKEHLITQVLMYSQQKQQAMFTGFSIGVTPTKALRSLWKHFTSKEMLPLIRLTLEIEVLSIQGKFEYQKFARNTLHSWVDLVTAQMADSNSATATLVVSVFSGLLLDYMVTEELERIEPAFETLLTLLEGAKR